MTLEEAKKIRACNGVGYSYVDFIKALQLTEPNLSMKGWVARDKANGLYFFTYKPHRTDGVFHSEISEDILHLNNDMFPELSWETGPIEVELFVKKI